MNQKTKIIQFGTGAFLRGYFDWMVQQVNDKTSVTAEVAMVKLTPGGSLDAFEQQNGEFHLVTQGLEHGRRIEKLEKISALKQWLHPYSEYERFLALGEDEELRLIVSNSTEAGLTYSRAMSPDECPASFPAKLTALLHRRFRYFNGAPQAGVTVLAFELVPDNATMLKNLILQHAGDWGLEASFSDWLESSCRFVNTLVDRIVSKPSEELRRQMQKEWDVRDELLIATEPYHILALEDDGSVEEILPLKAAGINVVCSDDLNIYRERKVKVLNGAHMLIVPAGLLSAHTIVEECMNDDSLAAFAATCLNEEIAATIDLPASDKKVYVDSVIERFKNPFLKHRLENIALNSIAKISARLLPSIADYYRLKGSMPQRLVLAVAIFLKFYRGELKAPGTLQTASCTVRDDAGAMSSLLSLQKKENFAEALTQSGLWDIPENLRIPLAQALSEALKSLEENELCEVLAEMTPATDI